MATLPNQSGGDSNIRKILVTDAVHADIVNLTLEDADQNIDAVNVESSANKAEIVAARGSESSLNDRITPLEATTTEVVTARGIEVSLDARLGAMESLTPMEQLDVLADLNRAQVPSGWLGQLPEVSASTERGILVSNMYSNFFTIYKPCEVVVDGYRLFISRANTSGTSSQVTLTAPPVTDSRVDIVFLEVWKKDITNPASTSQADRRAAGLLDDGTLATYGNVDYYGTSLRNGGIAYDPADASHRFQMQYRIRVVDDVDIATYPEGIDNSAKVKAWPAKKRTSGDGVAETSYVFTKASDDDGLYIAGDGSSGAKTTLGTTDGYVYAIPICAVFRRNTTAFNQTTNPNGAGAAIGGVSDRPDGLFSDQIAGRDVIDLRHQISFSGFNYYELLENNLDLLFQGKLRTNFVVGDGIGESPSVRGTYKTYCEQFGGSDVSNVNNRSTGNNPAITAMAPNGQRRNWNDAANTEVNHAKVSQTTTDLNVLNIDYGAKRTSGSGNWAHGNVITISSPAWAALDTGDVYIYNESGADVTSEFGITGSGNNADCTIPAAYTDTFTAAVTDLLTLNSPTDMLTGARVRLTTTGTLPAGLSTGTDYYFFRVTSTTGKLLNGAAAIVDITSTGTGVHTITQQGPSFATATNLHVVYSIDYPAGGGFVNVPSNMLKIEDSAGLLWLGDSGMQYEQSYKLDQGEVRLPWLSHSQNGSVVKYILMATTTNQIQVTLDTGFTSTGISYLFESFAGSIVGNITSWSQSGQVVTINVSSGIAVDDWITVQVYVDRPFARFQEETKAILGTYQVKEVSVVVDGSGNGTTYLDYGDVGLQPSDMYDGTVNIRDASNNIETGTVTVSAHKVVIAGCSQVSGTVKTTITVSKTVLNNDHLRVWYEYVPYMGLEDVGKISNYIMPMYSVVGHTTGGTGGDSITAGGYRNYCNSISHLPRHAAAYEYGISEVDLAILSGRSDGILWWGKDKLFDHGSYNYHIGMVFPYIGNQNYTPPLKGIDANATVGPTGSVFSVYPLHTSIVSNLVTFFALPSKDASMINVFAQNALYTNIGQGGSLCARDMFNCLGRPLQK